MRSLGTVLGVWAHPDDETYLAGGLMALARDAGDRVVSVSVTRGEHGTTDPAAFPPDVLGARRERELAAALGVLGVEEHHVLGLEDGTLAEHDSAMGAAVLGDIIRQVEPDTIVTFGPDGITGHPDHRAVSVWVSQAWRLTRPAARLLYAAVTQSAARSAQAVDRQLGVYQRGYPVLTPQERIALELELGGDLLTRKRTALAAHESQTAAIVEVLGEERYRTWIANEAFRDARGVSSSAHAVRRPRRRARTSSRRAVAGR
jgi:LmbE family N-acetylglucosaminyl deacetylase